MTPTDPLTVDEQEARRVLARAAQNAGLDDGNDALTPRECAAAAEALDELAKRRRPWLALSDFARSMPAAALAADEGPMPSIRSLHEQALERLRALGGDRDALDGDGVATGEDDLRYVERLAALAPRLDALAAADEGQQDRHDALGDALEALVQAAGRIVDALDDAQTKGLKAEHLTDGVFAPLAAPLDDLPVAVAAAHRVLADNPYRS